MNPVAANTLVVDDNLVNREILRRILQTDGHLVSVAASGEEALECLAGSSPPVDVVFLDIVMPGMDGFEVLQRIKDQHALSHIPVIMVSALEDVASVARCIRAGAADYLVKPIDATILRARLFASLAEKRHRDAEREYFELVEILAGAAAEVERGNYSQVDLRAVTLREDPLGLLARTFEKMAVEVRDREARLATQVLELRIEVDVARREKQVSSITGTSYFQQLRDQAAELRREIDSP